MMLCDKSHSVKLFCDLSQKNIFVSEIGDKIKELREGLKMSVPELAERSKLDRTTILKIEDGTNNPAKRTKLALAKALGNNLGDSDLDKQLADAEKPKSKKEIIEESSVEEIFSIKFGGGATVRSKEEILRLKKLLDLKMEKMLEES